MDFGMMVLSRDAVCGGWSARRHRPPATPILVEAHFDVNDICMFKTTNVA
jgi:hypothetical protein